MANIWDELGIHTKPDASATAKITAADLLRAMDSLKRVPRPTYDAFICTPVVFDAIEKKFGTCQGGLASSLCGIPVYAAVDDVHAAELYRRLERAGKRPCILGDSKTLPASVPSEGLPPLQSTFEK